MQLFTLHAFFEVCRKLIYHIDGKNYQTSRPSSDSQSQTSHFSSCHTKWKTLVQLCHQSKDRCAYFLFVRSAKTCLKNFPEFGAVPQEIQMWNSPLWFCQWSLMRIQYFHEMIVASYLSLSNLAICFLTFVRSWSLSACHQYISSVCSLNSGDFLIKIFLIIHTISLKWIPRRFL
jgi:hypothetical protein